MARLAMDTRAQNTWKELIEKEANTRIQSKLKHESNKEDDEWFVRSKYTQSNQIISSQPPVKAPITDINYPPRPVKQSPSEQIAQLTAQLRANSANLLTDMKKPDEKQIQLLYDGFSKEEKGRYQYLKSRKSENPEDKFEYPLLSSFEYGWKLKEVAPAYKTPVNGRSKIVEDSFYRRNGVF
jgi:hypothetical protein